VTGFADSAAPRFDTKIAIVLPVCRQPIRVYAVDKVVDRLRPHP
jgi:hypothetical protein